MTKFGDNMTVEEINQKYAQVCAELGDLAFKLMDARDAAEKAKGNVDALEVQIAAYRKVREDLQKQLNAAQASTQPAAE